MKYLRSELMYFDPNIEDQKLLHIGRLPARATIVPAQKRDIYYRNKEESSFVRSLNGDYRFLYLPEDSEKYFYVTELDDSAWNIIDVPSMWQFRGYGRPEYPNVKYPFPFLPPYIKKENPVGYYRKRFDIKDTAKKTILHFGGVDNAFYVYLNGKFVGFSKGSRIPSEFDVSALVKKGENLLAVKVFTYSDASYLENQDMLLASGIFRDVYLIESTDDTLWDYRIKTTYDTISIEADLECNSDFDVRFTLDGESVTYRSNKNLNHTFKLIESRLWSAEEPNLYDLYIELIKDGKVFEVHSKRVGIMHTRVLGNKLLVNEKPIYVKGINRHENNAKNGRAITVSQIENELKMIKANNLNAIRMAHYTNNPATYEIATELGLYVMDEADLETHGAYVANGDQGYLSKSDEWYDAYFDRVSRMLEINKNETCIFLRSTGNECGRGKNIDRLLEYMREFDPTRECVSAQDPGENMPFRFVGYYPMSDAEEMTDDGFPVIAIEYAHAMGNSPGGLEDYWDYNYTHEKMAGGFVWEFKSHGFYAEDENGTPYYKYGGDFDDDYHWHNFSLDGFCMSDGTPKTAWYELGQVLFAAYATFDGKNVTIKNTNDFLSLSYLTASYDITEDGVIVKKGSFDIPHVAPHESFVAEGIDLSLANTVSGARYNLNVHFYKDGVKVHTKQFSLGKLSVSKPFKPTPFEYETSVENYVLTVKGSDFKAKFKKGILSYLEKDEKILLDAPIKLNFFRAHTDNDGIVGFDPKHVAEWKRRLLDKFAFNLYDISVDEGAERVIINVSGAASANSLYAGFGCAIRYEIYEHGNILVSINGTPYGTLPATLPRIGVALELDKSFADCEWIGRGPRENYPDEKAFATVGRYKANVSEMNVLYDYPQETGNRENTFLASFTSSSKGRLSVIGSDEFSFSYHDFTLSDLDNARHKNELKKSESANYLYVDYRVRGLGSRACGPDPEEPYELRPHTFELSFVLSGESAERALELSRFDFGKKTKALSGTYVPEKIVKIRQIADCSVD